MAYAGWFCDAFGFPEFESFEDTRAAFTFEEKSPSLPPWLSTAPELIVRTDLGDQGAFFVGPFETPSVRHPVPIASYMQHYAPHAPFTLHPRAMFQPPTHHPPALSNIFSH
jgi:hypothetical protein